MRIFIIVTLLFAASLASNTHADNLGRLFFTPEQRAELEYNLTHHATVDDPRTSTLTVNGIVQRHGGTRTVWINGIAQLSGHGVDPVAESVSVTGKSQKVKIKVGQKLHLDAPISPAVTDQ